MFSWAGTETHWRGHQNVVRSSVTHSAAPAEPRFFSYHILMSSVIYYWRDAPQNGIDLLKFNTSVTSHVMLAIHNSHALRISNAFRAQPKKCAKAKISQWPHSRAKDTWEQLTAYSCDKKKQTNSQTNKQLLKQMAGCGLWVERLWHNFPIAEWSKAKLKQSHKTPEIQLKTVVKPLSKHRNLIMRNNIKSHLCNLCIWSFMAQFRVKEEENISEVSTGLEQSKRKKTHVQNTGT